MTELRATGLTKRYAGPPATPALDGLDLVVGDGITAVLGPSGCGKTTLLRVLAGLERPDAGTIERDGEVLAGPGVHVAVERRRIGLVPQEGALFPHLDVGDNIGFGLRGLARAERRARVAELLDLVDLPGLGHRRPHELSGGQQQRVALARALAPRPGTILLDEPFSALDTALRAALRDEVAAVLRETGTAGVLVTHDQDEALSMADRVAVLRSGRIVQIDEPARLYRRPADLWVARFVGDAVVLPGRALGPDDTVVHTPLGPLPLAPDGEAHRGPDPAVLLRPEQVVRTPDGLDGVAATVSAVRFRGGGTDVTLAVGKTVLTARWSSTVPVAIGEAVTVRVVGEALAFASRPDPPA